MVKVEKITSNFSPQLAKGISFTLNSGQTMVVFGQSGCGKSTLLFMLGMLLTPTSGDYYFLSERVEDLSEDKKRQIKREKISFLSSTSLLLPTLTVLDNLIFARSFIEKRKIKCKEYAIKKLSELKLLSLKNKFVDQLSIGESQRVSLLMALAKEPKLLLLDEPTSALDKENAAIFFKLLEEERKDKIVIITTHNKQLIDNYGDVKYDFDSREITIKNQVVSEEKVDKTTKKNSLLPFFIVNGIKKLKSEYISLIGLIISFFLSFTTLYLSSNLSDSLNRLESYPSYLKPIIIIEKSYNSEEEVNLTIDKLKGLGLEVKISLNNLFSMVFASEVTAFSCNDPRINDYNQVIISKEYAKSANLVLNQKIKVKDYFWVNSTHNYYFQFDQLFTVVGIEDDYSNDYQVVYFSNQYFKEYLEANNHWPYYQKDYLNITLEIESYDLTTAFNKLEQLSLTYYSPYQQVKENNKGYLESLSSLFLVVSVTGAMAIIGLLFLILANLKQKRNQDLVKMSCLGASKRELKLYILSEVAVYISIVLLLTTFLLPIILLSVNKLIYQQIGITKLYTVSIKQITIIFGSYLGISGLFSYILTSKKDYLKIKTEGS